MKTRTLYDVLQVAPNAAPPILEAAYRHLMDHCDLHADPAARRLIDAAYETLANPQSRQTYDAKLAALAEDEAPPVAAAQHSGHRLWSRIAIAALAGAIGYGAATLWHQRALTRMVLEHEASMVERQAQIDRLRFEQRNTHALTLRQSAAAEREAAADRRAAVQEARELKATIAQIDRNLERENRRLEREQAQREIEARRQSERLRRERDAAARRDASLAQARVAREKRELEQLYRENYPQYR